MKAINRDSALLTLGMIGGLVVYLAGNRPFWAWDYYGWLAFLGYAITVGTAWLKSSILAGDGTPKARQEPGLGGLVSLTKEEPK